MEIFELIKNGCDYNIILKVLNNMAEQNRKWPFLYLLCIVLI